MVFFIPLLVGAGVAIVLTITIVVTKDPPYSCYEKVVEGHLRLLAKDFRYNIIPTEYYQCNRTRPKTKDPEQSSCFRTMIVQFDGRETGWLMLNMHDISTEFHNIPFHRFISDGFKGVSITLTNYDMKQYNRTGWLLEPVYLDYYSDTSRLEGVTRYLRWAIIADEDGSVFVNRCLPPAFSDRTRKIVTPAYIGPSLPSLSIDDIPMEENGKNPQITTGVISFTLKDVKVKDVVVECPSK